MHTEQPPVRNIITPETSPLCQIRLKSAVRFRTYQSGTGRQIILLYKLLPLDIK